MRHRGANYATTAAATTDHHAALAHALGHPDAERALAMAAALGWYWVMRHRYADAVDWIDRALAKAGAPAGSGQRASAR